MTKTETVHTRVTPEIKRQADKIFEKIGLTTSQAIMLFLTASVNCKGLPFTLKVLEDDEKDLEFAKSVATVDGVSPSKEAETIMRLYSKGEIDYETAMNAVERIYKKNE